MHFSKVFIPWGVQLIVEPAHELYKITHGIYINNFHCYVTYCLLEQALGMIVTSHTSLTCCRWIIKNL